MDEWIVWPIKYALWKVVYEDIRMIRERWLFAYRIELPRKVTMVPLDTSHLGERTMKRTQCY